MNTIKSFLAASALATVASATNAAVWSIEMNASWPLQGYSPLSWIGFTGTWNDVSNQGNWSGTVTMPDFMTTVHFSQTFSMDETTGHGTLNPFTNCTGNTPTACLGLQSSLSGLLRNNVSFGGPESNYKSASPFVPYDGWVGQWNIISTIRNVEEEPFRAMPLNVCIHGWAECNFPTVVPVPTTAWLFGSGLISLTGAAIRRRQNMS